MIHQKKSLFTAPNSDSAGEEFMDKLEGRIAYLPDGQKVRIEYVADGLANVIRLDGQWRGEIAVCHVTSLRKPDRPHNHGES